MMTRKERYLTKSEEDLMEIFWGKNVPLTSVDLMEISEGRSWNGNYIHRMINALQKKGMIEVCGARQYGKQYAREFVPAVTREQYAAKLVISTGIGKNSLADVTVALVNEANEEDEEGFIRQLEEIIEELKNRDSKEK